MPMGRWVSAHSYALCHHVFLGDGVLEYGESICLSLGFPKEKGSILAPSLIVSNHGGSSLIWFQKWDR